VAVIVTWHVIWAAITNCSLTVIAVPAQVRVTDAGAFVATSQVPGPWSGTSATAKVGLSRPLTTPLEAFAADTFAFDLTFESVALEELLTRTPLVVGAVTIGAVTGDVRWTVVRTFARVTGEVVVVTEIVVAGVREALVECVVGGVTDKASSRCAGVELDEAVQVKTRTKRRTGLDHTTQWVLLSECGSLILVLWG
jgi:hypothetical protein